MTKETGSFRPFPKDVLERNATKVESALGQSVIPPSSGTDIYTRSSEELKARYPFRYQLYLDTLRTSRNSQLVIQDLEARAQRLAVLNNVNRSVLAQHETRGVLYERQRDVYEDVHEFLESGGTEGYVKLPTGTGKTVLFSKLVEAAGVKTLIAVPRGYLIDQTSEKFDQFTNVKVGQVSKGRKDWSQDVTVMTYNYFIKAVKEGLISPDDYGLLILDEAHKALGKSTRRAIQAFTRSIKLGFTATPNYSEFKKLANLLPTEIHNMSIREAVEEGLLCSLSVIIAETEANLGEVSVTSDGNYNIAELAKAVNIESRNEAAVNLYQQEFSDRAGIFYCVGVDHALKVADKLNERGITSAVISSRQSRGAQLRLLERYQNGDIQVLCNADILIEGFDSPRASVCMNLRPTFSPVVAEQRGGRVLRVNPLDPEKHAYIVDFIDQNANSKTQPISFAQVAEAAQILGKPQVERENVSTGSGVGILTPDIQVAGLRVITSTDEVMIIIGRIIEQKYTRSPEGWLNNTNIRNITGRSSVTVGRHAETFREEHPDYFKFYLDSGGRVVEYFDPRLVGILTNRLTAAQPAPEDWLNTSDLVRRTGRSSKTVEVAVDKLLKEYPEASRRYLDSGKQIRDYYSPEIVELVFQELTQHTRAPEGWQHTTDLVRAGRGKDAVVRRIAERFREEHPDWLQIYLDSSNNPTLYYSPELVRAINSEAEKRQPAPEGWMTMLALAQSTGRDPSTIKRLALHIPDSVKTYLNPQGRAATHVSPEAIRQIVEEAKQNELAPNQWETVYQISERIPGKSAPILKRFMEQHMTDHPEWFHTYWDSSNNPNAYFSPEAISIIEEEASKFTKPPEGWQNTSQLREVLWKNMSITRKRLEAYRDSHPEWFSEYLDPMNRIAVYYAPELIEIVKKEK